MRHPRAIAELFLCGAVLYPIVRYAAVQDFIAKMPRAYHVGVFALIALMIGGHLSTNSRGTFPFVCWWMYGGVARQSAVEWYSVEGITTDGNTVSINPSHLFPSLDRGTFRLPNRFRDLANAGEESRPTLAAMLLSFAKAYESDTGMSLR